MKHRDPGQQVIPPTLKGCIFPNVKNKSECVKRYSLDGYRPLEITVTWMGRHRPKEDGTVTWHGDEVAMM